MAAEKQERLLLSIIIPVYNVAPYLERCLSSVLACDLSDCEVLLSQGASTDRSDEICREFSHRYAQVCTLRQRGTGLSDARNCAMERAAGEYILFLDSDDFVVPALLDSLLLRLRDRSFAPDVVVTDFRRLIQPTGRFIDVFPIGEGAPELRGMENVPRLLSLRQCFWNVWHYFYRRDFLEKNKLRFETDRFSEDVGFTTAVFLAGPEIAFIHCPFYVYEIGRGDSIMGQATLKRLEDTVWMLTGSISRLRESGYAFAPLMISRFQFEYILTMAVLAELPPGERQAGFALFSNWADVLAGSVDPAVRAGRRFLRVFGLPLTCTLLRRLKTVKRAYTRRRLPADDRRKEDLA